MSTGQAIVEWAHWTIKEYLAKQKGIEQTDPVIRLQQVLFTLNFLSLAGDAEQFPVVTYNSHIRLQATPGVQICYKDPRTGQWGGPAPLLFNSQGYSCVSTDTGPIWVPSRWTKPAPSPAVDKSGSSECVTEPGHGTYSGCSQPLGSEPLLGGR